MYVNQRPVRRNSSNLAGFNLGKSLKKGLKTVANIVKKTVQAPIKIVGGVVKAVSGGGSKPKPAPLALPAPEMMPAPVPPPAPIRKAPKPKPAPVRVDPVIKPPLLRPTSQQPREFRPIDKRGSTGISPSPIIPNAPSPAINITMPGSSSDPSRASLLDMPQMMQPTPVNESKPVNNVALLGMAGIAAAGLFFLMRKKR